MQIDLCKNHKIKQYLIHRLVYCTFNSISIEFKQNCIMHEDDNPQNNRLDNLKEWSYKDNMQDCVNKWRFTWPRWEKQHKSILKEKDVYEIIKLLKDKNLTQEKIWLKYWVCGKTISDIKLKKNWKHLLTNIN